MLLCRTMGAVVSTQKDENLVGSKLLLVSQVDPKTKKNVGNLMVATDPVGAGNDMLVVCVQGSSCRLVEGLANKPVDLCIVGIVDSIDIV